MVLEMRRSCQSKSSHPELQSADTADGKEVRTGGGELVALPLSLPLAKVSQAQRLKNLKGLSFLAKPQATSPSVKDAEGKGDAATSAFLHRSLQWMEKGGLAQSGSPRGAESMVRLLHSAPLPPHRPAWKEAKEYAVWVSDTGTLNAEAFHQLECFPLQNLIVAYPPTPREVWRTGLESIQTGLFRWAFIKVSEGCEPSFLRKLQLASEKVNCRTFILCSRPLPHWLFRFSFGS